MRHGRAVFVANIHGNPPAFVLRGVVATSGTEPPSDPLDNPFKLLVLIVLQWHCFGVHAGVGTSGRCLGEAFTSAGVVVCDGGYCPEGIVTTTVIATAKTADRIVVVVSARERRKTRRLV